MGINFLIIGLATLVPLVMGFIWYNPKVMGKAWIKSTGLAEEELRKANMAVVFGLTILFSFMIAMSMNAMVIHQFSLASIVMNEPGFMKDANAESTIWYNDTMARYGNNFRTFKHGTLHGTLGSIFSVLPILGIIGLFERKGFKWIMIHWGYWAISMALMGGIICQWS